jgi:hypothetical protein
MRQTERECRQSNEQTAMTTSGQHCIIMLVSLVVYAWHCIRWYCRELAWSLMRGLLRRRSLLNCHAVSPFRSLRVMCRSLRCGVLIGRFWSWYEGVRESRQTSPCASSLCRIFLRRPRSAGCAEQAKSTSNAHSRDATSCEGGVGGGVHLRQSYVGSAA